MRCPFLQSRMFFKRHVFGRGQSKTLWSNLPHMEQRCMLELYTMRSCELGLSSGMIKNMIHTPDVLWARKEAVQRVLVQSLIYHHVTVYQIVLSHPFFFLQNFWWYVTGCKIAKTGKVFNHKGRLLIKEKWKVKELKIYIYILKLYKINFFFLFSCTVNFGTSGKQRSYDYRVHVCSTAGGMQGEISHKAPWELIRGR